MAAEAGELWTLLERRAQRDRRHRHLPPPSVAAAHDSSPTTAPPTASPTGPPFRAMSVFVNLPATSAGAPAGAKVSVGSLRLTPVGCGVQRSSYSCTGYVWNGGAGGSNEATFSATPSGPVQPSPPGAATPTLVRVGRVGLLNGGALLPADAGAALVKANATLVAEPAASGWPVVRVPIGEFSVYWTPGSPSPPNEAGVFRLAQLPAPVTFALQDGSRYRFQLEGFRLQPQDRMATTVPWPARIASTPGRPEPPTAMGPSFSVYQPKGEQASVVDFVGSVARV